MPPRETDSAVAGARRSSHLSLLLAAAAATYLLVTMGATVCATGARFGCPDWPLCYGGVVPPARVDAVVEYVHRALAVLTVALTTAAAVVGWRTARNARWVSMPPILALPLFLAVAVFGALAVLRGLPAWLAAVDVAFALTALALVTTAAVAALSRQRDASLGARLAFRGSFGALALAALVATFVVLVSGVLVSVPGSMTGCLGFPLFGGGGFSADVGGWPALARRLAAVVATVLIAALVVEAWRSERRRPAIPVVATLVALLLVFEATLAALLPSLGFPMLLRASYVAPAAALWVLLAAVAVLAGLRPASRTAAPASRSDVAA